MTRSPLRSATRVGGRRGEPCRTLNRGEDRRGGHAEYRDLELARLDALQAAHWPFSVVSLMVATAVRDGVVTGNVCADVPRPKADTAEVDYLLPAVMRQVMAAMSGHRLKPLLLLLASTGLRIGEALALRWSDLDLDAGQLRVTGTLQHTGGRVRRTSPKSQRSRRTLPINLALVEALKVWRKVQAAERLRAGTSWASSESSVFTTSTGRPWTGAALPGPSSGR